MKSGQFVSKEYKMKLVKEAVSLLSQGLTQTRVAQELDISRPYLRKILNEKASNNSTN